MKKVINGLTYNIETAEWICDTGNNLSCSDFKQESSDLYMTPKGRFFVYGNGGPLTRFRQAVPGGGWCGTSINTIVAIDEKEARMLVEEHSTHAAYIRCFGEPEEA